MTPGNNYGGQPAVLNAYLKDRANRTEAVRHHTGKQFLGFLSLQTNVFQSFLPYLIYSQAGIILGG